MALTAPPHSHPNWGRWSQQLPQDFSMMENQGFLPYDNRTPANTHIQRSMPPQYVVGGPYQPAPQYQNQSAFSYLPYQSPPPSTPISSPYKPDSSRMMTEPENSRLGTTYRRDSRTCNKYQPRSPTSRSGSVSSSVSKPHIPSPIINSKTITYNETINPADQVNFETEVDELMKAIQRKQQMQQQQPQPQPQNYPPHPHHQQHHHQQHQQHQHQHQHHQQKKPDELPMRVQQTLTPVQTPRSESMDAQSPVSSGSAQGEGKPKKKKWVCDGPNCNKSFVQKTHLDIHRRTHTGAKPYVCNKDNCGLTFSQRGNLKTHMRRHTGEKPYSCSICGKLFAQRGNVRSHEETHKGLKPFVCRLDDCNKTFSQLGNMKTHQNNFHKDTLHKLTAKFLQFLTDGEVPPSHQELFEYFQEHYKNSNKGIKGRGKARTVAARKPKGAGSGAGTGPGVGVGVGVGTAPSGSGSATGPGPASGAVVSVGQHSASSSTVSSTPISSQFSHGGIPSHPSVMHGSERVGGPYDMGHGPSPVDSVQRSHGGGYGMFEQHHPAPQGGMMYEDHTRQMGFAPRAY